jgi:hypothetical protein
MLQNIFFIKVQYHLSSNFNNLDKYILYKLSNYQFLACLDNRNYSIINIQLYTHPSNISKYSNYNTKF